MVKDKRMKFTEEDRLILNSYINLVNGLADYLGNAYEIVLHSLENYDNSVIAIINGHLTGRTIGSPVTDLALRMLQKIEDNQGEDFVSYFGTNRTGEKLKSSTIAIRGTSQKVIGLLCMNFYMGTPFSTIIETFLHHPVSQSIIMTEQYPQDTSELFYITIENTKQAVMEDHKITVSNKNKEIIGRLYAQGMFNFKDSVQWISEKLGISKNTVYLHLRNLQK